MSRFRIFLLAFEFWGVIAAFVPLVLSVLWLGFRNYLSAQNQLLAEYKPTIDTAALLVAFGSLIIGYLTLTNEIKKLIDAKELGTPELAIMQTQPDGFVKLRPCPELSDLKCPAITEIPPQTKVEVLPDIQKVKNRDGSQSTWRKVKFKNIVGWVNQRLLWPALSLTHHSSGTPNGAP